MSDFIGLLFQMSYHINKIKRMKTKYHNILSRDFGIVMSDSPTNVLVICNGGLSNGISGEKVCDTFEKFGNIENVVMIPGKSYCFVKYTDDSSAIKAYDKINGQITWHEIKGPLYLGFLPDINPSLFVGLYNFDKPPGLILIEDFITEEEEKLILKLIALESEENTSELKHRRVKHYGYEFKYSKNNVDLNEPIEEIPKEFNFLWEQLKDRGQYVQFVPDQLTINCYEPGQGIPPHVDTHSAFEDGILSLSLLSSIVMEFKNPNGVCLNVVLPRRSLCLMLGESRYNWTHGITPRKSDVVLNSAGFFTVQNREKRISLTFRKTRTGDCECKYPKLCNSFSEKITREAISDMRNIQLEKKVASELEGNYVHEVYEKIASHFSETRHKPWPNVKKFISSFEAGSILIDVGCGNGKYFSRQTTRFEIGCDSSNGLLQVCNKQGFECFSCNCLNIPIRDNIADGCICIAVIHHLTTEERRLKAIKEMIRILKPKGRALIYVWAKNQERESTKSSYLKQCTKSEKKKSQEPELQTVSLKTNQKDIILPVHVNRTNFNHSDLLVPWKLKQTESDLKEAHIYLRFYHVYEENELENVCKDLNSVDILDYYYDQGNWCIILEKK